MVVSRWRSLDPQAARRYYRSMADDLGARLVRAGLVTRAQLTQALSSAPAHGAALVAALASVGVAEDALVGFFVAAGYRRVVARDLAAPAPTGIRPVAADMAREWYVLPLTVTESGLVVVMADPSDQHAITELRYAIAVQVLPAVAGVSELRAAVERRYGTGARPSVPAGEDMQPIELVRRRAGTYAGSTQETERAVAKERSRPRRTSSIAEMPVPLVRTKAFQASSSPPPTAEPHSAPPPSSPAASKVTMMRTFGRPDRRAPDPAPVERLTQDYAQMAPAVRHSSKPPAADDSWDDLPRDADGASRGGGPDPSGKLTVAARRSVRPAPPPSAPPAGMADALAAIRAATTRDDVVALACDAALSAGRCAVFLALRRGILRGWEGRGAGLTRDAIRNLWIPATSPSRMRDVLEQQVAYVGPHGPSAADNIFKAATSNRGGDVLLQPVIVAGTVVGLLCVDDLAPAELSRDRAEVLGIAIADAFKRIIVAGKKG